MRSIVLALAASVALVSSVRGQQRHFPDATLRAVQFVDPKEGWAVGDEGVVWHTIDGGNTWERQPTGVRASLRSLHFLNPFVGWVAGREELPGGGSVGVLLFTKDGGEKWVRLLKSAIPGLNCVRFGDGKTGYVLGDSSDAYPTGVFKTTDGGRSWQPIAGRRAPAWLAADFRDGDTGVLAGAWSRLATVRKGGFGAAHLDDLGGRHLLGLQLREQRGIAVGQGGLLMASSDGGVNWGPMLLKLPTEVLANLDFHAVHCVGDHVWVVGRPGSVLLHSANNGASWKLRKTGQPLPLCGIHFFDEKRGWAVGELGTILATTDGGQSWRVQQRGGQRAALLFVHADAYQLPVETMAVLGADEGHLAVGLRVTAPDPKSETWARATESMRLGAALRAAGGAAGEMLWQFPLPQHLAHADKKALFTYWNSLHDKDAPGHLLRQLVLALRVWRPDVVVTDHPDAAVTGSAASAVVAEALHTAFTQAADANAFPEQIEQLGLEPWRVTKIYALWDKRTEAQVIVDGNADRNQLEASARDFAAAAAALLAETPVELPAYRFFKLVDTRLDKAAEMRHLMAGLPANLEGIARRPLKLVEKPNPEQEAANRIRKQLRTLVETPVNQLTDSSKLLSQLGPAVAKLADEQAATALLAVARQYERKGQWALAREAYLLMSERYPTHPLTAEAYRWLVRHNSSSEARRRHELGQFYVVTQAGFTPPLAGAAKSSSWQPTGSGTVEFQPKTDKPLPGLPETIKQERTTFLKNSAQTRHWYRSSLELAKKLDGFGPVYSADPSLQFCLQAARRQLGEFAQVQEWYAGYVTQTKEGVWRDVAASELWLVKPNGPPPRPIATCRQTATRPFLDGKFDDPCWEGHKPMVLQNAVGDTTKEYGTEAWLAYDQDFLYIALRCKHPARDLVAPVKVRPRDADLRPYDRVSILLDLDRDYSTYFHLQVDQRGCVCEDCWGDRSWDPQWFVAVRSSDEGWQIEAAIPLSQLTGDRVTHGSAWACNVVRTLPGRGVQAWSLPADVQPRPEGMGLLLFQPERAEVLPRRTGPLPKTP